MIKRLGRTICVKCSEIVWDTDGDKKLARTLPQSCDINIEDYVDGDDLDDEIANALSDLTGFCVEGFNYTIKNNK